MAPFTLSRLMLVAALAWPLPGLAQTPSVAQTRPPIAPTRDVAVTYRVTGLPPGQGPQAAQPHMMRIAINAGSNLIRIDGIGGGSVGPAADAYIILDRGKQRMMMVMPQDRRIMETSASDVFSRGFALKDTMKFVRHGTETVIGLKCTVWEATTDKDSCIACVTDDGVVLRSKWQDGKGVLEATQVTYAPQPAALFTPPAGFQKLELPAGMPPMGQPGNRPPGR